MHKPDIDMMIQVIRKEIQIQDKLYPKLVDDKTMSANYAQEKHQHFQDILSLLEQHKYTMSGEWRVGLPWAHNTALKIAQFVDKDLMERKGHKEIIEKSGVRSEVMEFRHRKITEIIQAEIRHTMPEQTAMEFKAPAEEKPTSIADDLDLDLEDDEPVTTCDLADDLDLDLDDESVSVDDLEDIEL